MRRHDGETNGMDMLLDTMCNTFGGVCFIALMVSLVSAALPKTDEEPDASVPQVTENDLLTRETARLTLRRDELKAAIAVQRDFLDSCCTNVPVKADLVRMAAEIAQSADQIDAYEKKRIEYLDELAKMTTRTAYSKREAARLSRLVAGLKEQAGQPIFDRHRSVRAPREHEEKGLKTINVWLHGHRLYMMDDTQNVRIVVRGEKEWDVFLVKGRGVFVDDDFFRKGRVWPELESRFGPTTYVRIFTDTASFNELCYFRDALIDRKSKFNWIVVEEDVIHFVEGYDGRVQ